MGFSISQRQESSISVFLSFLALASPPRLAPKSAHVAAYDRNVPFPVLRFKGAREGDNLVPGALISGCAWGAFSYYDLSRNITIY